MKFGIIVFPGSNCDQDCFYVVDTVLKHQVNFIWHKETKLNNFDCLIIPGGFSYGDYLRCGSIASFSPIMKEIINYANNGGLVLGICNGFQILLESGLLPGAMLRNKNLHFICKYIHIKTSNNNTPFTNQYKEKKVLKIPIAHNEGNYYIDNAGLKGLKENSQIVFQYCDSKGNINNQSNPNGTLENIAGITNIIGNVLGMMPHPERCSQKELGSDDGFGIFKSILNWLENKK